MTSGTTFLRGLSMVALVAGCVSASTGGTGGAGGQASTGGSGGSATGGTGGGGTGGTGGSSGALPDYKTTVATGKISGRSFGFVTGFVSPVAGDASSMQVELLGFSPELGSTPCWNKPPPGSNRDTELSVLFRVPAAGGSFEWGAGKTIAGTTTLTLVAAKPDGSPQTSTTDRGKVNLGPMPAQASGQLSGSIVIQADANNSVNGTFTVYRCDH